MRLPFTPTGQRGSVLVIVLWVALGLVAITLYFANSMSSEMRAADNRVAGIAADQAIAGGVRYVTAVLSTLATNGVVPDVTSYQSEAVPVGDAHFWLIGRPGDYQVQPDQVFFALVDEGSKLNLNTVSADMLNLLTNMTPELAANIVDWRDTNATVSANGDGPTVYSQFQPAYLCKNSPYETVNELRLVYPTDLGTLMGEDLNLNGALDPSEMDTNRNGVVDGGLLEYATVYSREPNTASDGSARVNIASLSSGSTGPLLSLLETNLSTARANEILTRLNLVTTGPARGNTGPNTGGRGTTVTQVRTITFSSPLQFYRSSGMTLDEFALVGNSLTVSSNSYIEGRINVNTASTAVLTCLPGITADLAQQLVEYRRANPESLTSIAWVAEALGQNNANALDTLQAGDYLTTQSYQFTADIAALGPYGRGYRRVKYVFDLLGGSPKVIYRQDLTHLGWALGKYVRQSWLYAKDTR